MQRSRTGRGASSHTTTVRKHSPWVMMEPPALTRARHSARELAIGLDESPLNSPVNSPANMTKMVEVFEHGKLQD